MQANLGLLIGQLAGNESPDRGRLFADDVLQFVAYLDEVSLEFDAVALSPRKPSHNRFTRMPFASCTIYKKKNI